MTCYPLRTSPPSSSSLSTRSHTFRTSRRPQSSAGLMKALIAFYQDEQYWVLRARMVLREEQARAEALSTHMDGLNSFLDSRSTRIVPSRMGIHCDPIPSLPLTPSASPDRESVSDHGPIDPLTLEAELPHTPMKVDSPSRQDSLLPELRLGVDDTLPRCERRRLSRSPVPTAPHISRRILDMYADLLDARMESCQRLSRLVEMREEQYPID